MLSYPYRKLLWVVSDRVIHRLFLVLSFTCEDDALKNTELFDQCSLQLRCSITQLQDSDKNKQCLNDEGQHNSIHCYYALPERSKQIGISVSQKALAVKHWVLSYRTRMPTLLRNAWLKLVFLCSLKHSISKKFFLFLIKNKHLEGKHNSLTDVSQGKPYLSVRK